jgi:tripartite-type tricarboxylate transporter receptor subunit TctC
MRADLRRLSILPRAAAIGAVAALCGVVLSARADPVADFYRGKTVSFLISAAPGGGYDTAGRLLARYLGKYIPGNPTVVPQNMEGAGGLRMANYVAHVAAPDGLTVALHGRGIIQQPLLGDPAAKFDPLDFTWLSTMSSGQGDAYLLILRRETGVASIEDMRRAKRPTVLGSVGGVSTNVVFALVAPELFGVKIRLIKGYPGSNGVMLAVERKEVDGTFLGLSSLGAVQREQVKSGELVPILQFARQTRHPAFPDVPLGSELLTRPQDKALLDFIESLFLVTFPFSGPPHVPPERTQALRKAMMAAYADPDLKADAEKLHIDLSPLDGEKVTSIIAKMKATPRDVIERYKGILAAARKKT